MKQGTLVFKSTKGASTSAKPKPKPAPAKRSIPIEDSSDEEDVEEISPTVQPPPPPATEHLDLKDKKGLYRKLHHDSAKLSGPLIHAEETSKIHHILRVFDNSEQYGPCVGITRLERWERAHDMGLEPPPEIRRILLTVEGLQDEALLQSVYYGEVLY